MATFFRSSALARGEATQALPLLRATWPDIDLARWQEFVEAFADRSGAARSGVLALRDAADCLCGLVAYRVERNLRHGAVLSAHLFTAIDLANSLAVLHALLDAVESKSVELGCEAHEIRLWKEQAAVVTRLRTLGLSQGAGLYAKPVHHRRQAC